MPSFHFRAYLKNNVIFIRISLQHLNIIAYCTFFRKLPFQLLLKFIIEI